MEYKYYTPNIEEFRVGFEYESLQDERSPEEDSSWSKGCINNEYDLRTFIGYYCGDHIADLRVKCLDKEDIESLGFSDWDLNRKAGEPFDYPYNNFTEASSILATNIYSKTYGATIFHGNIIDPTYITIYGAIAPEPAYGYMGTPPLFRGYIKNKSELETLLKQLRIWM